jgi:hypothetical protein
VNSILAAITAALQSVGSAFAWLLHRSELKNAPDVRDAAKAQAEVDARNKEEKAVAKEDVDQARKDWAE